jgi:uncharacterized protein YndB with AHSA1/START domain
MKAEPFVIERTLNAPAEKVWRAITDRDQMEKWYFNIAEFKLEPGFEFSFMGGNEDNRYRHMCRITEVIPGKKLQYTWRYDGFEGLSYVTFELFPEGNATLLRLTHESLETFPTDDHNFARENFVEGWTYIIGTSIKNFVEA